MTTKNKAARVAVQAEPCPNDRQVMQAACLMVANSLQLVIKEAVDPAKWRDEYHDAISAVEVALDIVRSLEVVGACALDGQAEQWWRAASVVRLAMGAFPDKETTVWRHLSNAVNEFVVLQNFVDFVSEKLAQKGGAV